MTECRVVGPTAAPKIMAAGWVLRRTSIDERYVLLLTLLVFALAAALLARKSSRRALRRGFALSCAVTIVALTGLGCVRYRVLLEICREEHVVEWLTAAFLLAAWVLGLIVTVRLSRQGRPSPMAAFLTAGGFWAFWREIEWGATFFGDKVVYTRNFFRLRAYVDPSYLEEFGKARKISGQPVFALHWIAVVVAVLFFVVVIRYLHRHRKTFLQELKELPKSTCGRFFFLGAGIYVVSQIVEKMISKVLKMDFLAYYRRTYGLSDRTMGEPVEALGALAFLLSMVALWWWGLAAAAAPRGESSETNVEDPDVS